MIHVGQSVALGVHTPSTGGNGGGGGGTDTFATLNGSILTLADGQTYDLAHVVDTDTDTFATFSGGNITFQDGTVVNLNDYGDGFATLNGTILTLADGQTYDLEHVVDTDTDTFATLNGTTITFANGDTIEVNNTTGGGGSPTVTADTGTTVDLSNWRGNYCNMAAVNNNVAFDFINAVDGGQAIVKFNTPTPPIVNNATQIVGVEWTKDTDYYLLIEKKPNRVEYSYIPVGYIPPIREHNLAGRRITDNEVAGVYEFDLAKYSYFVLAMLANTTFNDINRPTGDQTKIITVKLTGNFTPTWNVHYTVFGDNYNGAIWNLVTIHFGNGEPGEEDILVFIQNLQ